MEHITVCVCTYQRQDFLRRVLERLRHQATEERFTYSIVVADNDRAESGHQVVRAFAASAPVSITYCVEPRQNIALARNRAVAHATGDYIAFLDDDELPVDTWLRDLHEACGRFNADGVLGTARPDYEVPPPAWVVKAGFYERASHPTGHEIGWRQGRTGNLLLRRRIFDVVQPPFREEFLTGEDHDFFRRAMERGFRFVWSAEALTREIIPAGRWRRSFLLRRALLRGKIAILHPTWRRRELVKSLAAIMVYALVLPFTLLAGQHRFMDCLVRLCDHLGLLLAWFGIDPIREKYVTR